MYTCRGRSQVHAFSPALTARQTPVEQRRQTLPSNCAAPNLQTHGPFGMPPWHKRKGHRARVRPDGTRRRTQGELEARAERQEQRAAVTPPPPLAHASRRRPPSPPPPSRKCARADPEAVEVVEVVDVEDVEEDPLKVPDLHPPPSGGQGHELRRADRVPGPSSRDSRSRPSSSSSGMAPLATRCPREAPRTPVYGERRRRISGILIVASCATTPSVSASPSWVTAPVICARWSR